MGNDAGAGHFEFSSYNNGKAGHRGQVRVLKAIFYTLRPYPIE